MRKWGALISVGVILLVILGGIRFCLGPGISHRVGAVNKLLELLHREKQILSVSLETEDPTAAGKLFWCTVAGERCYGVEMDGFTLYYQEESLYLDNGRGYDLSEWIPDVPDDPEESLWLLLLADYQTEATEYEIIHRFTATERLCQLADRLLPEASRYARMLLGASLTISERQGELQNVRIADRNGNVLTATVSDPEPNPVPTELLMVMKAEETIPVSRIIPLIKGCIALAEKETIGAEAELALECGPLPIEDRARIYYSGDDIWFERSGYSLPLQLGTGGDKRQLMVGIAYILCRDGAVQMENDGTGTCILQLEPEDVKSLFQQVLPEASGLQLRFEEAMCQVRFSEDGIDSILLQCSGRMPFLITEIPIAFSMNMKLMEGNAALPDVVRP